MKKRQSLISEDKILEASWELLDEDGIDKFSMRRLAERLGIQAPSLYWHFKSKQHLYYRLANQIHKIILDELQSSGNWKEQLTALAHTTRNVLVRYPCSTQLMMMTLPHEPDIIRFVNRLLICVEETPLKQEQKIQAVYTLVNFVLYFVLDGHQHQQNIAAIVKGDDVLPVGGMTSVLDGLSDTEAGLFKSMFKSGTFDLMGTDTAFEFGLKLILLGIEQVIKEQTG